MTPSLLREKVVTERVAWIREMIEGIETLPLENAESFLSDRRNVAAAESYLRRALEALLDLGRHILAKGFGTAAVEYKQIAVKLLEVGVLSVDDSRLLQSMAGYRNRMDHFYEEVTQIELYDLCSTHTGDVERVLEALLSWIRANPDRIDRSL